MPRANQRIFTGWHMATILVAFFGIVIAVNLVNARYAGATFGGVVVENSYVASQQFNDWLDEAKTENALGWDAVTTWRPDGRLVVALRGVPTGAAVKGVARHPLGRMPDRALCARRGRGCHPAVIWALQTLFMVCDPNATDLEEKDDG